MFNFNFKWTKSKMLTMSDSSFQCFPRWAPSRGWWWRAASREWPRPASRSPAWAWSRTSTTTKKSDLRWDRVGKTVGFVIYINEIIRSAPIITKWSWNIYDFYKNSFSRDPHVTGHGQRPRRHRCRGPHRLPLRGSPLWLQVCVTKLGWFLTAWRIIWPDFVMFSGIPFIELEFRCIHFPWNKFHSGKTAPFVIITLLTVVVLAAQIIFIPDISDADEVWTLKSHFIAKCFRLSRMPQLIPH